jgi:hypothetical protein
VIVLPTTNHTIFRVARPGDSQLRAVLRWYADSRLRIPRFHLREHALRAGVAFFSTPEIKQ